MQIWVSKYELTSICLDPPVLLFILFIIVFCAQPMKFKVSNTIVHVNTPRHTHTHAPKIQTGRRRLYKASTYQPQLKNSKLSHNVDFLPWLGLDLKQRDPAVCRPDLRVLIETNVRSSSACQALCILSGKFSPKYRKFQQPRAQLHFSAFLLRILIRLSFTSIGEQSAMLMITKAPLKLISLYCLNREDRAMMKTQVRTVGII